MLSVIKAVGGSAASVLDSYNEFQAARLQRKLAKLQLKAAKAAARAARKSKRGK